MSVLAWLDRSPRRSEGWLALMDSRVDSGSLLELVDEQEALIEQRSRQLDVARRSLDRARTRWLVLQNYDNSAGALEREEAAMHLEGLLSYVQQLEDSILTSRSLIRAYKKARMDNMPMVRALGFVRRQVGRALPPRAQHPLAIEQPVTRALEQAPGPRALDE